MNDHYSMRSTNESEVGCELSIGHLAEEGIQVSLPSYNDDHTPLIYWIRGRFLEKLFIFLRCTERFALEYTG